jgi:hypothetical protein
MSLEETKVPSVDEKILNVDEKVPRKKQKEDTKRVRYLLSLPCSDDGDDESTKMTIVDLRCQFRNEEQYEELNDCGVFADCLREFNDALMAGKGFYKNMHKDMKKGIKRDFYVDDGGIEIQRDLRDDEEIDLCFINKK